MRKRWMSMLLSVTMLLGLSCPAFAEGEAGPPPVEDAVTAGLSEADIAIPGPVVECGGPATEDVPEDSEIAAASYEAPVKDAALPTGGVTVNITGAVEQLRSLNFYAPGGEKYDNLYLYQPQKGLCRFDLWDDQGNGEYVQVGDALPGQFSVYPGTELIVETEPDYDVTISGGTVERNTFYLDHSSEALDIDERLVNLTAPDSGSMTVTIAPAAKALPRSIPLTMYGGPLQGDGFLSANVGDETSFGQWSYTDPDQYGTEHGTIFTGTKLCYQLQSGYTIEVVKGGKVVRVGGYCYPTNITDCVGVDIQVDDDATEFVYAILKQGEHFDPSNYTTPVDMNKFRDESADTSSYAVPAMNWALNNGVLSGYGDQIIQPRGVATRAEVCALLMRFTGA